MHDKSRPYESSAGAVHWFTGVLVSGLAMAVLAQTNGVEMTVVGFVILASGGYLLLSGGVARGIQLARLAAAAPSPAPSPEDVPVVAPTGRG